MEKKGKKKSSRYFGSEDAGTTDDKVQVFTPDLSAFLPPTQPQTDAGTTSNDGGEGTTKKKKKKKKKQPNVDPAETETFDLSTLKLKNVLRKRTKLKESLREKDKALENEGKGKKKDKKRDPFPGDAPVSEEKTAAYRRGEQGIDSKSIKTKYHQSKFEQKEKKYEMAAKQAARSELLLEETTGYLEAEEGESMSQLTQHDIAKAVDITSASKFFELNLKQFGPYRCNYTRNGRQLLIGGKKGHVAAIDWQTKKLMCEINVMETVEDVRWLHTETMFSVAQKQWTYIYDNQGVELHCLKMLDQVLRLDFLPYHFLLAASNARGYLSYIDISVGQKVAGYTTGLGRLDVMCQNPRNAIIHMGHTGGTVTLWSPNIKEPLAKILCHGGGTRSIAIDNSGQYMATSGLDRTLKLWDLRTYKQLRAYRLAAGAGHLAFSQKGLLAASIGNMVEVYADPRESIVTAPYLSHRLRSPATGLHYCPYEDVMGVGHSEGFTSLIIPGAGEPNFDALEANPFQTKKQRQQAEVKMLLEKVQPEMIHLDTTMLGKVDTKTLQDKIEERQKILYLKPEKIEFEPKYKKKGRNKTGRLENRKKGVKFERRRDQIKQVIQTKQKQNRQSKTDTGRKQAATAYSVFDRFKVKPE